MDDATNPKIVAQNLRYCNIAGMIAAIPSLVFMIPFIRNFPIIAPIKFEIEQQGDFKDEDGEKKQDHNVSIDCAKEEPPNDPPK